MFRISITAAALATAALALPGAAAAGPLEASAHLEAHAVLDSGKAVALAHSSADKAKDLVGRSEARMKRAYELTVQQGNAASAQGLQASAQFSSSADAQGDKLAELVRRSRGSLKAAAADALVRTGRMQAALVAKIGKGVSEQQGNASEQQAQGISEVGDDNASLTATIVVTASGEGLEQRLRGALQRTGAKVRDAHGRLMAAVAELRKRSEGQGQQAMGQTQSSLAQDDCEMSRAVRDSKNVDVTASAQDGNVKVGDTNVADTGDRSGAVSASGEAHATVTGEGGSC
jgi:hypothetical protein